MIRPTKIRELLLTHAPSEQRAPHLSAASGLVNIDSTLYVVADDENHLAVEDVPGLVLVRMRVGRRLETLANDDVQQGELTFCVLRLGEKGEQMPLIPNAAVWVAAARIRRHE